MDCPIENRYPSRRLSDAAVAQWIEYWPPKPRVVGSIPASRASTQKPTVCGHFHFRSGESQQFGSRGVSMGFACKRIRGPQEVGDPRQPRQLSGNGAHAGQGLT
jgi:hypothetical protein